MVGSPCNSSDSQESSPTSEFESINSLAFSLPYGPILTSVHDYWKTIVFTIWTFVGKVLSLLFNMLSRFVITVLPWIFLITHGGTANSVSPQTWTAPNLEHSVLLLTYPSLEFPDLFLSSGTS